MSVGFGFSVGDFIAALKLVETVTSSLRASGDSGAHYRTLIAELELLGTCLNSVKQVELDESQYKERISLEAAAAAECQKSIDTFFKKIQKFDSYLQIGGSGNKIRCVDESPVGGL